MQRLRDVLDQTQQHGVAVGHFNVADLVLLKAVFASARELNVPVLVGASEGEREFLGVRQIATLVRGLREEFDFPIFLNADHTHSLQKAVEAAKAGFDAIVFDASALPFDQDARNPNMRWKHSKQSIPTYSWRRKSAISESALKSTKRLSTCRNDLPCRNLQT